VAWAEFTITTPLVFITLAELADLQPGYSDHAGWRFF
jgi:hypothetical protein